MKTKRKISVQNTKEQRRARRVRQVRLQKLLIGVCAGALLLTVLLILSPARKHTPGQKSINQACESYREQIAESASKYEMTAYVDLLLALMMQESSGTGPDVMQSSEGAYNTQYPQVPNGITDTAYSIECGIQELKYAMEKAGVTGPTDMEHISLALQAYNFGADVYFSYMEKQGNRTWSVESSEAFAQMASGSTARAEDDPFLEAAGPWAYGDQYYPQHVLQYYHP